MPFYTDTTPTRARKIVMTYKWEQIREAVVTDNRLMLKRIGESFKKPMLEQEGVTIEEAKQQILGMAPGDHPHLGPILLDLAEKLKQRVDWR